MGKDVIGGKRGGPGLTVAPAREKDDLGEVSYHALGMRGPASYTL